MYHLRLKGNHYEMGVKRGRIFQKCNISFPLNLDNFQLKHGKESDKILAAIFPEACEEITWKTIYPLKYGDVQLLLLLKTAG